MCLDKIDKKPKPFEAGYKVFLRKGNNIYSRFQGKEKPLPIGIWLDANDFKYRVSAEYASTNWPNNYNADWHTIKELKHLKHWHGFTLCGNDKHPVIFKVECRDMHVTGTEDDNCFVGVSRYIKILEEVA